MMEKLTDLEICKRMAEIEGKFNSISKKIDEYNGKIVHVQERHTFLHRYNPLTDDALCFQLMVKYEVSIDRYTDSAYIESDYTDKPHKSHVSFAIDSVSANKAILLAIIEANNA